MSEIHEHSILTSIGAKTHRYQFYNQRQSH